MALTLDQPEINYDGTTFTPGTVNLTPTISDLYGAGRPLSMNVSWCLDPGIAMGVPATCTGNPTQVIVIQNQSVSTTATYLAPNYTGSLSSIAIPLSTVAPAVQAIVSAGFSGASTYQQYNGVAILIFFELFPTSDPTLKVTTFKRLILSSSAKTAKNQNPTGLQINNNGTEITDFPTTQISLDAYLPANQAETYSAQNSVGILAALTETIQTTWFFTGPNDVVCSKNKSCTPDGYFALTYSNPGELNLFYPPVVAVPTTRGRVLIAVTHDSRGGNMVKRYCSGICP